MMDDGSIFADAEYTTAIKLMEIIEDGDRSVSLINDPEICMINGGSTTVWLEDGKYYSFSEGPNWRDQVKEERTFFGITEMFGKWLDIVTKDYEKYTDEDEHDTADLKFSYLLISPV